MSPTIPILSALLLSLISGSTGGGQRMDSVALLRQTLRYWRKIYKTYHEEVMLGYCWADYLLEISDKLSANLSAAAATGRRSESQQKPFSRNVIVRIETETHGDTRTARHSRSRTAASSTILDHFINGPDEYRHRESSRSGMTEKRQRWTMNTDAGRDVALNGRCGDGNNSGVAPPIDSPHGKRRRAFTMPDAEVHDEDGNGVSRRHGEFSSRRIGTRTVDPPSRSDSPKDDDDDDDKVVESTDLEGEKVYEDEDTRRLRSATTSHRDSPEIEGVKPRSFSLEVPRGKGRGRSRFQRRPRERSPRVNGPLRDYCRMPEVDRATRRDRPEGRRVPLSDDGDRPTTSSRLQFRRVNADTGRRNRDAVKPMDSEGNSSRDLTGSINSRTSRRKCEELSRDSLLSPRGDGTVRAERSALECRGGGRMAIKRNVFPRVETTGASGSSTWKRRSRRSAREEEGSRSGGYDSLVTVAMRVFRISALELRTEERRTLYGEWWAFLARIPRKSGRRDEQVVRAARGASSLPLEEFISRNDYAAGGESTGRSSIRDSGSNVTRDRQSLQRPSSFSATVRSIIVGVFRTLGMFVQVGRQIMDVVESNTALACTKEYLWTKIINWIDA